MMRVIFGESSGCTICEKGLRNEGGERLNMCPSTTRSGLLMTCISKQQKLFVAPTGQALTRRARGESARHCGVGIPNHGSMVIRKHEHDVRCLFYEGAKGAQALHFLLNFSVSILPVHILLQLRARCLRQWILAWAVRCDRSLRGARICVGQV